MSPTDHYRLDQTRRHFLKRSARGIGGMALASLLNPNTSARTAPALDQWSGVVNPVHVPATCKRVIWLYMAGGPSHLESFDYKPKLEELNGQPMPKSVAIVAATRGSRHPV